MEDARFHQTLYRKLIKLGAKIQKSWMIRREIILTRANAATEIASSSSKTGTADRNLCNTVKATQRALFKLSFILYFQKQRCPAVAEMNVMFM